MENASTDNLLWYLWGEKNTHFTTCCCWKIIIFGMVTVTMLQVRPLPSHFPITAKCFLVKHLHRQKCETLGLVDQSEISSSEQWSDTDTEEVCLKDSVMLQC